MKKTNIDKLRTMWQEQGIWGQWRAGLQDGYGDGEAYFEFGLIPENVTHEPCFRIVLDHEVHVLLSPVELNPRCQYAISVDPQPVGKSHVDPIRRTRILFVSNEEHRELLLNARAIFQEYHDDEIGCFWSIPNRWFADLLLVDILTNRIVLTEDYKNRVRTRQDWYWP